jgi:hypothetical protein
MRLCLRRREFTRRSAVRSLLGTADDVGINPKEARMS